MSKYLLIFSIFIVNFSFGQTQKFGFVYEDYIIANLKETKTLQDEIASKKQQYETELQAKAKNYQEKYEAYQAQLKDVTNITTESLNASLKNVQGLQKEYNDFQTKADSTLQVLAQSKFLDLQEKVRNATKTVANEKGYKYVIRKNVEPSRGESNTFLLYSANEKQDNLTDAVLIKLGTIPPKK
jgi:outer membrane protein